LRRKAKAIAISLFLLTILGPFGTYDDFDLPQRAAYWLVILVFCSVIFEISVPGFLYSPSLTRKMRRWLRFAAGVLVASFFATWGVYAIEYVARGSPEQKPLYLVFVYVVLIGGVISYFSFMHSFSKAYARIVPTGIDFERIAFFSTYPELKGSPLLWITMEDHYARVVTEAREVTLHASMQNLERQLNGYPGMRVHRSHWVANDAMQSIDREGRKVMLRVDKNQKLPIGGKYQKQVEAVFAETAQND